MIHWHSKQKFRKRNLLYFQSISDCGYYSWYPNKKLSTNNLIDVDNVNEIIDQIHLNTNPSEILNISHLKLPYTFNMSLPSVTFTNRYPFGQYSVASLYVASKYRGVNMNEIDFIFGGSTLNMLANEDMSNPYMVTRIPTTKNTILIIKCMEYEQNLSDVGFQFERFVTGGTSKASNNFEFIEHIHLMHVGKKQSVYKVMFCAETDAIDADGNPMEVKVSNPMYWGTKTMFQMISNGAPKLCTGTKGRNIVRSVKIRSLSDVTNDAMRYENYDLLEQNILNGMKTIQEKMIDAKDDEVYKIVFDTKGLYLQRENGTSTNAVLLPPAKVVKELLQQDI